MGCKAVDPLHTTAAAACSGGPALLLRPAPSEAPVRSDAAIPALRIAVGIATVGRPHILRIALEQLARQSRPADCVLVCAPTVADLDDAIGRATAEIILGPLGLTRQRNAILQHARQYDILVFFDDDFLPAPSYLAAVEDVFRAHADVVMMTGAVIADGVVGAGLAPGEALRLLADAPPIRDAGDGLDEVANGYGCNMAVRLTAVRDTQCDFDEKLPLYGWLEDVDFSLRLASMGRIVRASAARGVHLGIKQGRQSGIRLGYSQIANPFYLARKGTCPWPRALRTMTRNIAANCLRSLRPEPYIDRRGRLAGNMMGLRDLIERKLDPERILEL